MGKSDNEKVLKRLVWLLDTIYQAGYEGITKEEIFEKWRRKVEYAKYGDPYYPARTFRNHLDYIADLFDVEIECVDRRYRVAYRDGIDADSITAWMVNSIAIQNVVVGNAKLRERILFEPVHAGWKFLQPILDAMETSVIIKIEYRRFDAEKAVEYTVMPYFLKLFRRRWYLVGYFVGKEKVYTFSLDRITGISPTAEGFEMPEVNESDFFSECFGIIREENSKAETVQILVYGEQVDYIKSAPLHDSQRETDVREGCSLFEYKLHITYDFIQELLSHGNSLKVIAPDSLKRKMREHVSAMMQYYP